MEGLFIALLERVQCYCLFIVVFIITIILLIIIIINHNYCYYYYYYYYYSHYYITIIIIIIIIIIFFCFESKFVKYRLFFFPCNCRNLPAFKWTKEHDVLLAREMLTAEPYKCKNRSRESGQAWDLIAANLNSVHAPCFRVSQKSVRDMRARIMLKNFKLKIREEEVGIEVEELSEY